MIGLIIGTWMYTSIFSEGLVMVDSRKKPSSDARSALRAQIFRPHQLKREVVNVFGADVEVRQPTLRAILNSQQEEDRMKAMVDLIVEYCYVPGSDEKVFEIADADALLAMPFDQSLVDLNAAISRLTGVDVAGAEKNSASTPSASRS